MAFCFVLFRLVEVWSGYSVVPVPGAQRHVSVMRAHTRIPFHVLFHRGLPRGIGYSPCAVQEERVWRFADSSPRPTEADWAAHVAGVHCFRALEAGARGRLLEGRFS